MSLTLKNRWHYIGNKKWDWEAFIDDNDSGELVNVKSVEYLLHPTFKNPIRVINDPTGGFLMKTNGWGIFELKAFVHFSDGKRVKLTHDIVLSRNPESGTS